MMQNQTIIFTDGASKGNPGPGGWGSVVLHEGSVYELGGRQDRTTNNRMELQAAISGLEFANKLGAGQVLVYSDSSYVIDGITKWIHGWKKNGWKTKAQGQVLNDDLWKMLEGLVYNQKMKIEWKYLGGHIGIAGNERVDEIATVFADGNKPEMYTGPLASYKIDILNLEHDEEKHAAKSAGREHSRAKAYSYVSKVDGVIQTHKTWAECEARVKGKTARFKKAVTPEQEKEIIEQFGKEL